MAISTIVRFGVLLLLLLFAGLVVACGEDDQTAPPTNGEPPTADVDAELRAEAEAVCPQEFLETCAGSYVTFAKGSLPAALCVSEENGTWYFTTPGATPDPDLGESGNEGQSVGDDCREAGHKVVAVVGG